MAKKKGFIKSLTSITSKKVEKTIKKVTKETPDIIESYFGKVEGHLYTPHGLVSEAGKEFPGQPKTFRTSGMALEWAIKHKKGLVKK